VKTLALNSKKKGDSTREQRKTGYACERLTECGLLAEEREKEKLVVPPSGGPANGPPEGGTANKKAQPVVSSASERRGRGCFV